MSNIEFNINWKLILDVLNPDACSTLDNLDQMLEKAFLELPISEKLMIRPFFELLGLKHILTKVEPSEAVDVDLIKRQIHARLSVLNENGDFLSLLKKFSHLMESFGTKRSFKQLARKGAQILMDYVGVLKNLGDLY